MFKSHSREKLLNSVIFFAGNTQRPEKRKLLGLLYLLDFDHFMQTGHSVTGLEYAAWKHGPVPIDFFAEWDNPDRDLAAVIGAWERSGLVIPRHQFDRLHFSRRELELMGAIAGRFADASAEAVEAHARNEAWRKVWNDGLGGGQVIDYALAIPEADPHRQELLATAREYAASMLGIGKRAVRQRHPA